MQLALCALAKTGQIPYRLHRRKAAHQAAHRAEDALGCAIIAIIGVMRVADKAAIAGSVGQPSSEGSDLTVELANGRADQRNARS